MIKSYSINNNFTSKQELTQWSSAILHHSIGWDITAPGWWRIQTSEMVKSASSKTHDVMKNITIWLVLRAEWRHWGLAKGVIFKTSLETTSFAIINCYNLLNDVIYLKCSCHSLVDFQGLQCYSLTS